jgi:hypothetical protein
VHREHTRVVYPNDTDPVTLLGGARDEVPGHTQTTATGRCEHADVNPATQSSISEGAKPRLGEWQESIGRHRGGAEGGF